MTYTNRPLVENYLKRELTEDEEAYLMVLVPAIEMWIDRQTGSTFKPVPSTTRYYDGGVSSLDIDPATNISAISSLNEDGSVGYSYTNQTEYLLEPANGGIKSEIRRHRGVRFPHGTSNIAVTAQFTEYDGEVPADIRVVATRVAGDLLKSQAQSSDGSTVAKEMIEGHTIEYDTSQTTVDAAAAEDPLVMAILEQRRQPLVG